MLKMYLSVLKRNVIAIIKKDDPHRLCKMIQLDNWCQAFHMLFKDENPACLPFVLHVLSDEECWEEKDSMSYISLNRKMVAKILVELKIWKNQDNPLSIVERFKIACCCCLEDDIVVLFNYFRNYYRINSNETARFKVLVFALNSATWSDDLVGYWSHVVGGFSSHLPLSGMHLYEYGLNLALKRKIQMDLDYYKGQVEAVEFFWNKIKYLPEVELSAHRKHEIFTKALVNVAGVDCLNRPYIFQFCFTQINLEDFRLLLDRHFAEFNVFHSFLALKIIGRFDEVQILFDYVKPNEITEINYYKFLKELCKNQYSKIFENEAMNLFLHIWLKEGYDKHRELVITNEMLDYGNQSSILTFLVERNYMELAWTVLDRANPRLIKTFMNSSKADGIRNVLENRRDTDALHKFSSYLLNYTNVDTRLLN